MRPPAWHAAGPAGPVEAQDPGTPIPSRRHGLAAHLVALTLAVLGAALAIGLVAALALRQDYRAASEARLRDTARALATALDGEITAHLALAQALATSPHLDAGGDLAAFRAQAAAAAAPFDSWVALVGPGPEYRRLVHTLLAPGSPPRTGLLMPEGEAPIPRVFATGQPLVSDVARGSMGVAVAQVFVPVAREGRVEMVLALALNPARVARLLEGLDLPAGDSAAVADGRGQLVAHSLDPRRFAGAPAGPVLRAGQVLEPGAKGLLHGRDHEGLEVGMAFGQVRQARWTVGVASPAAALDAASRRPLLVLGLGGLALLLLALPLAWLLARHVVRPLGALARAAEEVASAGTPTAPGRLRAVPATPLREAEALRRALVRAEAALEARAGEARAAAEEQAALSAELSHRVRNALAVVQAALTLTPREGEAAERYARTIQGRVGALARAHAVLARHGWAGGELRPLLEGELRPFIGPAEPCEETHPPRVELDGPRLRLHPGAVQPLATVLHELAANATRHGALSRPEGRLRLSWRLDPAASLFRLDWAESGGPGLDGPPGHQGFGSRALEASVRRQLGGELRQQWLAEGLRCEIALPMELVSEPAQAA